MILGQASEAIHRAVERKEREAVSERDNVTLTLVCVACGKVRAIRVPRKRGVPAGRHLWECLDCQAKGTTAGSAGRSWIKRAQQEHGTEPPDREEK